MARVLDGNPNLTITVQLAVDLGASCEVRRGTGELKLYHPSWRRHVLVNGRRKDTPRMLLTLVRRLAGA